MDPNYVATWSTGWGWFVWIALMLFVFSSFGSWGYTYRIHRRLYGSTSKSIDILNERYAKGEITAEEFRKMKYELLSTDVPIQESKPV